jgi:hypothetical protein
MAVQVTALGHASEKRAQSERAGRTRLFHTGCGLLLRRARLRVRWEKMKQKGQQQSKLREAAAQTGSKLRLALILGVTSSWRKNNRTIS